MSHIHTQYGQHDITASGFIVKLAGGQPRLMLHFHSKVKKYMQFGGHVELNEDPIEALKREIKEETGYDADQLEMLLPKERIKHLTKAKLLPSPLAIVSVPFAGNPDHFHDDIAYALVTEHEPSNKVDEHESTEIIYLSRQELLDLSEDKILDNIRQTGIFILDKCVPNWERVSLSNI